MQIIADAPGAYGITWESVVMMVLQVDYYGETGIVN